MAAEPLSNFLLLLCLACARLRSPRASCKCFQMLIATLPHWAHSSQPRNVCFPKCIYLFDFNLFILSYLPGDSRTKSELSSLPRCPGHQAAVGKGREDGKEKGPGWLGLSTGTTRSPSTSCCHSGMEKGKASIKNIVAPLLKTPPSAVAPGS